VDTMRGVTHELDHSEDEIFGGIKRVENLVSADRQSRLSRCSSLYFDEAEFPGARIFAFNVVSHLLELSVHRLKAEPRLPLPFNFTFLLSVVVRDADVEFRSDFVTAFLLIHVFKPGP